MSGSISDDQGCIELSEHSSTLVMPRGDESFVISEQETDEFILVNSGMQEFVHVSKSTTKPSAYHIEVHDQNATERTLIASDLSFDSAIAIAADFQAFSLKVDGDTYLIDPNGNGGIFFDNENRDLPIHLKRDGGSEYRLRKSTTEEQRYPERGGLYIYETRSGPADNWTRLSKGKTPTQPPLILGGLFESEFIFWSPVMDDPPKRIAEEAQMIKTHPIE